MAQKKQAEWLDQWRTFQDNEKFLFQEWISPNTIEDFTDKVVLEAGCGGGQHTSFIAPLCKEVVAVDLNSIAVAAERNKESTNIRFLEEDISDMDLDEKFDIVFCIGVVHHTDDPDKTVENLIHHLKPGGRIILWVYSKEGNWIAAHVVEAFRRKFLTGVHTNRLVLLARVLTAMMYVPIYTLYLLPLPLLPYYEYFQNFRRLSFERNVLNVFDKLNAPQVRFIAEKQVRGWFPDANFLDIHIAHYKGVSWQASATLAKGSAQLERDPQPDK